eukprot:CAMPEP_0172832566 /NCGR_PEP_ID=MMETSP1075-20121228/23753_1 /TAXON_ID=2916 /ORGANISM="Ceratium fusus, Strain PA161109" /LENGTH=221 /DNA_ID=CAMNT_0013675199 /DNA_START=40 /DNA_END=702 /DNA_ORIENTATION=+
MKIAKFHNRNHAVSLVGWGTATALDGSKVRYWLVQNSWGRDWEIGGFGRLLRGRRGDLVDIFEQALPGEKKGVVIAAPSAASVYNWEQLDQKCRQMKGLEEEARYCLHGEVMPSCGCRCHGKFSGQRCDACLHKCGKSEVLDETTCSCQCKPGYFGDDCVVQVKHIGEGRFRLLTNDWVLLLLAKDPCFGNNSACSKNIVWEAKRPLSGSFDQQNFLWADD